MIIEKLNIDDSMNPFIAEEDLKDFIKMLYERNVYGKYKGSVVICKKKWCSISNDYILKQVKWINTDNYNQLEVELMKHLNEEDVYININPMRSFKSRSIDNIHQYKFLYQDLDIENAREKGKLNLTINQVKVLIDDLAKDGVIPYPTMIVNSGRGLHLYWSIGDCPNTKTIKKYWKDIQLQLYKVLKPYGADKLVVKDGSRLLRVPGTINSKNKSKCHIVQYNKNYMESLNDIRDKYFKDNLDAELNEKRRRSEERKKKNEAIKKEKDSSSNVIDMSKRKTTLTLHKARMEDLIKLIKMRNGVLTNDKGIGRRNVALLQIAYWYALTHKRHTEEEILQFTLEINRLYKEPLTEREVKGIVKSAFKYARKKILVDEEKKVQRNVVLYSDSVPNNPSYWVGLNYNTSTLLDLYSITSFEMSSLTTLIDFTIKNERDKNSKKAKRRGGDPNGLTAREQKKKDTQESIQRLKSQGLKQKQVSEILAVSLRTVKTYWN